MVKHPDSVKDKRAAIVGERFSSFGCSERFELLELYDSSHVMLRCKSCGNEFSRHTAFLSPSKDHNVGCNKCGMHANGSFTNPRSDVKRKLDEKAVEDYYSKGFSIQQTAAKFKVNSRRVSKIVDKAGIRRSPLADANEMRMAIQRERNRRAVLAEPKDKRRKTIADRFEKSGCNARFEIARIVNRTHIVIRCRECGREFRRETSFLDTSYVSSNIGCPECGIHVDGTRSKVMEFKKDVDESAVVEYYGRGMSVRATGEKFGISYTRVNVILDRAGIAKRSDNGAKPRQREYAHELTGDPFLDEEFACAWCGREFTRHDYMVFNDRKTMLVKEPDFCCRKCSKKASDASRKRIGSNGAIRHSRERRAAERKIPLGDLIERDGGICQICGKPVDLDDISFDEAGHAIVGDMYPSKDHIVPLSRGGKTTWENVQLTHIICNSRKSSSTMDEYQAATKSR